tara:strand:- start:766 stop:1149 length:384 start_codon:yes stop_codon:yes gene_type:complete
MIHNFFIGLIIVVNIIYTKKISNHIANKKRLYTLLDEEYHKDKNLNQKKEIFKSIKINSNKIHGRNTLDNLIIHEIVGDLEFKNKFYENALSSYKEEYDILQKLDCYSTDQEIIILQNMIKIYKKIN